MQYPTQTKQVFASHLPENSLKCNTYDIILKTRSHLDIIIENEMTRAVLGEKLKRVVVCEIFKLKPRVHVNVITTQD